ncbi:MAG: sulfatase-like hydrolase/transferase [Luteolibacter sp.]|jgi:phosphoglycerol transferase MdoB-like AlkP superfamily enzyme|nr:sulfatase-like hydrolase/transferase [Luteolibacter sp.]
MRPLFRSIPARLALIAFSLFFAASLLTRIGLLITARHEVTWDASIVGIFANGAWFDAASAVFAVFPWLLLGAVAPARFLQSTIGKWIAAGFMTVFAGILIFITTAEWFFWDEFGARFNFIAVDYLVWTQEVWGNISESYPMIPIFCGIAALAGSLSWWMNRKGLFSWAASGATTWVERCAWPLAGLAISMLAVVSMDQSSMPVFANQYHGELAKNGCWSFFAAFKQMEIDYEKWYAVLPKDQALGEAKRLLSTADAPASSPAPDDLHRSIAGRGTEQRWNVIVVCMESMSGDFMSYLGNKSGLTPNLDRIAKESIFFENLYATGTRTVRGMEALTLSLPPTPGQAIIYRPEGTDLTTTFSPFLDRGYDCAFFYGGDGRFDFMNRYFFTAGCRVMDAGAWKKEDVTFKTAWGACDEDLFRKTIAEADSDYAAGKPFHFFCMTTSNHRPYDFPSGRIDRPSHGGRKAAVKYADWALGNLIEEAGKRPWFKDTLFVICSDHCASSAGKLELDVTKYRIPAMIYNPSLVTPQTIGTLSSQIDVMPTMFGLLNWNYDTLGYGHDLLAPAAAGFPGRAFVSNYQKLALLRDDGIAILKPNRKFSVYACDLATGDFSPPDAASAGELVRDTTAFYQSASWLFKSGRLKKTFREAAGLASAHGATDFRPFPMKPLTIPES